jgi:DNA-binding Lrp family transcriptional regulator
MVKIDSIDRRILEELQLDAGRPIEQIASRVGSPRIRAGGGSSGSRPSA